MCEHYNSRLATYDEIENAYNNGANWLIMVGLKIKWLSFQHKKVYRDKEDTDMEMTAVDLV